MTKKKHRGWPPYKGYWYDVYKQQNGSVVSVHTTRSKKEALAAYRKHKKAIGIQRYRGGTTSGKVQTFPKTIKVRGKTYKRAYHGPHSKTFAANTVRDFKEGGLKAVKRKYKKGWQIFVR